jgi:hypothetical protein
MLTNSEAIPSHLQNRELSNPFDIYNFLFIFHCSGVKLTNTPAAPASPWVCNSPVFFHISEHLRKECVSSMSNSNSTWHKIPTEIWRYSTSQAWDGCP